MLENRYLIGYCGPHYLRMASNAAVAREHAENLCNFTVKEVSLRDAIGPFTSPPLPDLQLALQELAQKCPLSSESTWICPNLPATMSMVSSTANFTPFCSVNPTMQARQIFGSRRRNGQAGHKTRFSARACVPSRLYLLNIKSRDYFFGRHTAWTIFFRLAHPPLNNAGRY